MILGCFYMSIPVTWSEYSFICLDYHHSRLYGRLYLLHGLPHPPKIPTI